MEHFAKSRFWRAAFLALVAAVAYLGWSLAGERSILPVAHAGGVVFGPGGAVYTTSEAGDVLYVWPVGAVGAATASYAEQWSFNAGTVTRRVMRYYDQPGVGPTGQPGESPTGRYGGNR